MDEFEIMIPTWAQSLKIAVPVRSIQTNENMQEYRLLRMTPELLSWLCEPTPEGRSYRVIKNERGIATVETVYGG